MKKTPFHYEQYVLRLNQIMRQLTSVGSTFEIGPVEIPDIAGNIRTLNSFKIAPSSLTDIYRKTESDFGDSPCVVYEGKTHSFASIYQQAYQLGCYLERHYDIKRGDRIALAMRNRTEWMIAFIAITSIGAVVVCLNGWWSGEELNYAIEDSGAKVLLADRDRLQRLTGTSDFVDDDVRIARISAAGQVDIGSTIDIREAIEQVGSHERSSATPSPHDPAIMLYTSGTTGRPKGAISTHFQITNSLVNKDLFTASWGMLMSEAGEVRPSKHASCLLLILPLFHVSGCITVFLSALKAGSKMVMMYKWDAERALQLIESERVTSLAMVPTMTWDMLESPNLNKYDISSLAGMGGGGMAQPPRLAKQVKSSMPDCVLGTGWGLTESNGSVVQIIGEAYHANPTSVGPSSPITELKIVDEAGVEVPIGDEGEILIRSCTVFHGYWNRPEDNKNVFTSDGWLRTGDAGRLDSDNFLYIADRIKDVVIRAGENIYTSEVESTIMDMPEIREVAAIGIPHEKLGEELAVAICTLPDSGGLDKDRVLAFLSDKLASFKIPTYVYIDTEQLPRNHTGKILKNEIRDRLIEWVSNEQ